MSRHFLPPQSLREMGVGSTFCNDPRNAATNLSSVAYRDATLGNVSCNVYCNDDVTKLRDKNLDSALKETDLED